jgi:hypothetical protein
MDSLKVFFKGGTGRCSARFFLNFDIFTLTTRGLMRLRRCASVRWPHEQLAEAAQGRQAEPLACLAQAGAVRGSVVGTQAAGILEDLSEGQLGKDSHGQDHPEDDFAAEKAAAAVKAAGSVQGLLNVLGADNLQQQQAV